MIEAAHVPVAHDILLDSRLALFHQTERWLAIADLHFGYEISQRAAGRLMPLWGMDSAEKRLWSLLADYAPQTLVILGDLVHDSAAETPLRALLEKVRASCTVIALAGNHDRKLGREIPLAGSWATERFLFHHGHCDAQTEGRIQIIGHHHPAATLSDGAGLRLKFPAFVQTEGCWILPAFSPWSSGLVWKPAGAERVWLCAPQRILLLEEPEPAAA